MTIAAILRGEATWRRAAGPQFDRRPLDARVRWPNLERYLGQLEPSETDAGPVEALQAAARLPEPTAGETRIAYLITDFRRPQWEEQAQLRQLVGRLRERVEQAAAGAERVRRAAEPRRSRGWRRSRAFAPRASRRGWR